MKGYQVTFITQQSRTQGGLNLAEWIVQAAKEAGIPGATINAAASGYGRDGQYHSTHFFETGEQPLEVTMAVSPDDCDLIFRRIIEEGLNIFYIRTPIEFGITGKF